MYDNLFGVKIKGAMFEGEKNFPLFSNEGKNIHPTRVSIVYGKNGSGKSTITKAFQKFNGAKIDTISNISLYNFDSSTITETDDVKQSIFVFNEDFIEKNVKIKEDGLETIIMFGEQADLEETINDLNLEREKKLEEFQFQEKKLEEFNDSRNLQCPSYHLNRLRSTLQGDENWAGIDRNIKGGRSNSPVSDSLITAISTQTITATKKELELSFNEKKKVYDHLTSTGEKIAKQVPKLNLNIDINKIWNLLSIKIEKPQLSEREEMILDLVMRGNQEHFMSVYASFSKHEVDQCPFCLQTVSEDYKNKLTMSIENVLNKDVENHIKDLQDVRIQQIDLDFSPYTGLGIVVEKCEILLQQVNDAIDKYNQLIDQKIYNTYSPIVKKELPLEELYKLLDEQLCLLETSRNDYNKKFDEVGTLRQELVEINKQIAYYSVNTIYQDYLKQEKLKQVEKNRLNEIIDEGKEIKRKLQELQDRQKSIRIAVDYINKGLKYVFFSSNRLSIETAEDRYVLFSNNLPVKPHDISCGERNILALCYFFTLIMNNEKEKNMYTKEALVVIDDPVSSFDLENKVGILSYLKSQLLKVLSGNKSSRVILFSHDLATVYDLMKQFEEIKEGIKIQNKEGKDKITTNFSRLELENFAVKAFSYKKRNEYTSLVETIYDFAIDTSQKDDLAIGNIMRRMLEAFATFEYKKGIEAISCDQEILSSMNNPLYSQYFENLMYRLILNGESHLEERLKSLHDLNFYATISLEEKRRTAKDVLCLIYVLNRSHLKAHLFNRNAGINNVDDWCKAILEK
ncbi:AAA family ATPase [Listeria monocytogenes]|uniref:AAA family ATPase n=1 Tax=Listeria monocytogenes TaxID=1639 RepID=UPI000873C554|nr:AAA family ATPase [Listeria monocytogenes]EHC5093464.1 AAA family ATPase [Listeria monocytogenes serotype 1/2a]EEP7658417.1 AAA family ATPase [Listeria monocytogenes]EEP7709466.1 AAA family ATPase [Listeria monocytogenes]EEP7754360.1 AAA family ATPase [Listeria monocytogenes]EFD4854692.1 AAA family ATPase [Listeria monocytogenes]